MASITRTSFSTGDIPTAAEWNTQFDTVYNRVNTYDDGTGTIDVTSFTSGNLTLTGNTASTSSGNWTFGARVEYITTDGITASTTQSQGQGALTSDRNYVSTCANEDDTNTAPACTAGGYFTYTNGGAEIAQLFPASGDNLGDGVDTAIKVAPGTTVEFYGRDTTNWKLLNRYSTTENSVAYSTGAGHGSTNTVIRRIETEVWTRGKAIAYASSSSDGTSFTIKEDGQYNVQYQDLRTGGAAFMGISLNSNQLTTGIDSITATNRIGLTTSPSSNNPASISATIWCSVGDVIRPHTTGNTDGTNSTTRFTVTKVS